jgi:hypothetical protein
LACSASDISPISSRNSVPWAAISKTPFFVRLASVNAPFSKPKSSDSSRFSGTGEQLSSTNGSLPARALQVDLLGDQLLARAGLDRG